MIVGYAYAAPWKPCSAYRFVVESSIYLPPDFIGHGFGSMLYRELIADLRHRGVHTEIGGCALPNAASVALHEKLGYKHVAHLDEVGFKFGKWWMSGIGS